MNFCEISIIIPVFNVEGYIDRFMDCLKNQTIQNFTAIFIDDKSPDNSMKIVAGYKNYFKERMVVIENEKNLGLSGSRNRGLEYVSDHPTKYVTYLDPDDWMDLDYLEDLYKNAEEEKLDLCISGLVRFDDDTKNIICTEMVNMRKDVFPNPNMCDELAYINPCAYSKLYNFNPIKDLRFRRIKRSEDTCYLFEALRKYKRIKFTNNAKYHYCVRNSSLTAAVDEEKYISMHEEFAKLLLRFEKDENRQIRDKFVTQIFIRSSLGGVCRLCFKNMKMAKKMEKREFDYLEKNIGSWRRNPYLSFGKKGIGSKKEFALKVCALAYKLHIFFIFIWMYYIMNQIVGKDVRA